MTLEVPSLLPTNDAAQQPKPAPLAAAIRDSFDDERTDFVNSLKTVASIAPAEYGKANATARLSGIPAETLYQQRERMAELEKGNKYAAIYDSARKTANALRDGNLAAVAQNDLDALTRIEGAASDTRFNQQSLGEKMLGAIQSQWTSQAQATNVADAGNLQKISASFDAVDAEIARATAAGTQPFLEAAEPGGFAGEYLRADPEQRQLMRENLNTQQGEFIGRVGEQQTELEAMPVEPAARQIQQLQTSDQIGIPLGGLERQVVDTGEGMTSLDATLAALTPGFAARTALGAATSSAPALLSGVVGGVPLASAINFGTEFNVKLADVIRESGVDFKDPAALMKALQDDELMQTASDKAVRKAAGTTAVDALGMLFAGKLLAPARIAGRPLTDTQRELTNLAVQFPVQGISEAAGEAAGQLAAEGKVDAGEVLLEGVAGGLGSSVDVMAFGGKRMFTTLAEGLSKSRQARIGQQSLSAAAAASAESETRKIDPGTFQQIAAQQLAGTPLETLWIPAEELQRLNQSGAIDLPAILAQVPGLTEQFGDALIRGGNVAMKGADYLTYLADYDEQLSKSVRTSAGSFSADEAQAWSDQQEEQLTQLAEEFRKGPDARAQAQQDFVGQLVQAGFRRADAEQYAALHSSVLTNLAERNALGIDQLNEQFPLDVRNKAPEDLRRVSVDDATLAIQRLRAGDIPQAGDIFGKSLGQYLRDAGGVNDAGGELAALDADVGRVGRNRLTRKDGGMTLDDAAMNAWERGYFPGVAREDVTPQLIVDAVQSEMAGNPVYSAEQENPNKADTADTLNQLQEYFDRLGVNLAELSDEEALALLRNPAELEGQRLEQFAGPTAWTADVPALHDAEQQLANGASAEEVRQATGWFKGADGRWRFEIDDSDATFKDLGDWVEAAEQGDGVQLEQVLNHPALFAAYPELGRVMVRVDPERTAGGLFAAQEGRGFVGSFIEIGEPSAYADGTTPAIDILMHEIQHAIQLREGFAPGGSPSVLRAEKDQAKTDFDYWAKVATLRREADRLNGDYEQAAHDYTEIFETAVTSQELEDARSATDAAELDKRRDDAETVLREIGNPDATYERLAGEIEARNTERRRTMTADERQTASPEQTADMTSDRAVVRWGETEMRSTAVAQQAEQIQRLDQSAVTAEGSTPFSEGRTKAAEDFGSFGDFTVNGKDLMRDGEKVGAITLRVDGNRLVIDDIEITKQSKGTGTAAIKAIIDAATDRGMIVSLTTDAMRGKAAQKRLREYYERLGFIKNAKTDKIKGIKEEYYLSKTRLNQGGNDDDARGFITFSPRGRAGRKFNITLGEKRDLSTLVHELGHYYLEVIQDLAQAKNAPVQMQDDVKAIRDWVGAEGDAPLTTEQHEQFARGFEQYLAEGKAPAPELAGAFARFKRWMLAIYKHLSRLNVALNDDVRQVFDRIVASDEQIQDAERVTAALPLFKDAEAAGMTEREFAQYQNSVELAHTDARDSVEEEIVREEARRQSKWWNEQLDAIRNEVTEEVDLQPEYVARNALRNGQNPDGSAGNFKLSSSELADRYGKPATQKLAFMHSKDGISLDLAANILGFESGDDLVKTMLGAQPRKAVIEAEAMRRMEERHGPKQTGEIAERAMDAVHNERRAEVLGKELRRLAQVGNRRNITSQQILKEAAARVMSERKVRDIQPIEYQRAEAKASREAFDAFTKGDLDGAYEAKQRQLLNFYLYREASKAKAEVETITTRLNTYNKTSKRQKIGKAGGDYLDQIDAVMEQYEFRNISLRQLDKAKSYGEWYQDQVNDGKDPFVPEFVLRTMGRLNYKELSLAQLQELDDFVAQLNHLASLKGKLQANKRVKDKKEAKKLMIQSLVTNMNKGKPMALNETSRSLPDAMGDWLAEANSSLMKLEQIIEQADGGDPNGAWSQIWWQPLADAQARRDDLNRDITAKLLAATDAWFAAAGSRAGQKVHINGLGMPIDYNGILAVALNSGNASNLKKMLAGNKYSDSTHAEILGHMREEDWRYVVELWDIVNSLWPDIVALEKQVNGIAPEKIEGIPIQTPFGVVQGAYWPLFYDYLKPEYAEVLGNLGHLAPLNEQGGVKATTSRGHTKGRIDAFAAPVVLDVTVIANHLSGVIHDLTHRVAIADARSLITDSELRQVMNERMGQFQAQQFINILDGITNDLAPGSAKGVGIFRRTMTALRSNAAIAWMGYSVTTVFNQLGGASQALEYFAQKGQRKHYMRALAKFSLNPLKTRAQVLELSGEMRNRAINLDPAIRQATNRIIRVGEGRIGTAFNDVKNAHDALKRWAFVPMSLMQSVVDTPVWMGAYEAEGGVNSGNGGQDAIAAADRAVRLTQMAGGAKDLAPIQHNEMAKFFLLVYGYASLLWNRNVDIARSGTQAIREKDAKGTLVALERFVYLNIIPAILAGAIKGALPKGDDDDRDKDKMGDTWPEYIAIQTLLSITNGVPLARDAAQGFFSDFGYGGVSPLGGGIDALIKATNSSKTEALVTNMTTATGMLLGLPSSQINRATRTFFKLDEGELDDDAYTIAKSVLFGPPPKKD